MGTLYATQTDLYDFGLPRGSLVNAGRLATLDLDLNAIKLDQHGFSAEDPVSFRGDAGGDVPDPLEAHTTYYAIPLSEGLFRVSATAGGSAIDLATGHGHSGHNHPVIAMAELPVDAAIDWASRMVDNMLPAHIVPFTSYADVPDIVKITAAELASGKLLHRSGSASSTIMAMVDTAQARLARWAKGVPLRGVGNPANLSVAASAAATDPTGWKEHGGL